MSTANKIFTNTAWQVVIRVVNILIGIFSIAVITRILGVAGFGFYTTIFAFVQTGMILADLGLYLSLLRMISNTNNKEEESKIINNVFTIRLISALFILCLLPWLVRYFPYDLEVKKNIVLILLAFLNQSLISTLTAVFAKYLAMPLVAIADLTSKLINLLIIFYLFFTHASLVQILLAQSLSMTVGFILFLFFLKKYVRLKLAWDFDYWLKIFRVAWPLAVTVVLNLVYFKADTLILSAYRSSEDVGLYGVAYRVLEVLTTFPHMFMSLMLPLFTAAWINKNKEQLKKIWQHSFNFFVFVNMGLVSIFLVNSRSIIISLAGSDFVKAAAILNILIFATAAIFFGTLYTYLVVVLDMQKQMIKYVLVTAIIGIIGYFLFIPIFSYWAAAIMTLFVEVLLTFMAANLVKRHMDLSINLNLLLKNILAGLLSIILSWPFRHWPYLIGVFVSIVFYSLFVYILGVVKKENIRQLLKS